MEYVVIANGKIKSHLCSQGKPTVTLLPGETLQEVKEGFFNGLPGDDIRVFDSSKGWQRKANSQLYKEGLLTVPKGMKLEGEEIVSKSIMDQYHDGEITREEAYYDLGLDTRRKAEISRITDILDRHRNEKEAMVLGIRSSTTITDEEYAKYLVLLEKWKAFKESVDIENPVYPE